MLLTNLRSSLLILRSTMGTVQQLLHLKGNIHLYLGIIVYIHSMFFCSLFLFSLLGFIWKFCACRPSVIFSDNTTHNSAAVTDDFSKFCIKDIEKPQLDSRNYEFSITGVPLQVPQRAQGRFIYYHNSELPLKSKPS